MRADIFWGLGETHRRLDQYDDSLRYYGDALQIYSSLKTNDGLELIAI